MSNFRPIDRDTGYLLPPSVDDWLPEAHLARFIVEVIDGLDLRAMSGSYRGSGSASYHPALLLGILVYGYATGVFSSRKLERATFDSVAFRFIAANENPDHDTIAAFRRRFLKQIEGLFVEVLMLAREMGMLNMGTVGLDGTKIHANASRHSALSYEHASKIEAQLKAEVADLMAKAEAADQADLPDGLSVPEELARREERLRKLAEAKAKIEARAKERYERELAEHLAKLAAREAKSKETGRKPGGKPPSPPAEGPRPSDQVNLTDEESRIMPVAGGGFEQCYNVKLRSRRVPPAAEIGVDDPLVAADEVGRTFRYDPTLGHDHHLVGAPHDDVDIVFDEEEGHALLAPQALDLVEQCRAQRSVDSRHRLIEQHEPRLGHQRARKFEQLALPARKRPGIFARLGVEGECAHELLGAFMRRILGALHRRSAEDEAMKVFAGLALGAEHHVVAYAHRREYSCEL